MSGERGKPTFVELPATADPVPVLVSIPHTGTRVPAAIDAAFASDHVRALPMTDWHLHRLYDFLPALGITVLHAVYSRFVVDLNRPPDARPLYPGRFETGLVAERTFDGQPVYHSMPGAEEVERRRLRYHAPYHARLRVLLEGIRARYGRAVLIDAHSVASGASLLHGPLQDDIFLGDRDGRSAGAWLIGWMEQAFASRGYRVRRNQPYKGGYITDEYGRMEGVEALQIEMCQRVYMDESAPPELAPDQPAFARAREDLRDLFAGFAGAMRSTDPGARSD